MMMETNQNKPSHEEWLYWSHIVAGRIELCLRIYSSPLNKKTKLTERDRQHKNARLADTLGRLFKLIDESETPTDSLADVAHHDEQMIDGLAVIISEIAQDLPPLSSDMQDLLNSHWRDGFPHPTAHNLFHGEDKSGQNGIGSGQPEHGRLPAILQDLILREQSSGRRKPRPDLQRPSDGVPARHDAVMRRWGDMNSRFMRRAGQVE